MAVEFTCPACSGTLRVEDESVGQLVRCGECMIMLRVPEPSPPPPSFPGAPSSPFPDAHPQADSSTPSPPPRPVVRSPASDDDESHGEPVRRPRRRRSRREPPPPTGRSPTFWVMLTILVLGMGSCVFCCGLGFVAEEKWKSLDFTEGGFKVELPASPRKNMSLRGLKVDPNFKIEGTRFFIHGEEFAVLYRDIDRTKNRKADKILDDTLKELGKTLGKEGNLTSLKIGEFPAREVKYHTATGATYLVRVILADTRLYILIVGSQLNEPDELHVQRFFNSFEITDPKLLVSEKERKEQEAKDAKERKEKEERDERESKERAELMAQVREIIEAPLDIAIAAQERVRQERERQIEQAWVAELGLRLAELPMQTIAANREEHRLVIGVGKTQTDLSLQTIAREKEVFERERLTILGTSLAEAILETIAGEQRLAAENRVKRIGEAVGTAIAVAIRKNHSR